MGNYRGYFTPTNLHLLGLGDQALYISTFWVLTELLDFETSEPAGWIEDSCPVTKSQKNPYGWWLRNPIPTPPFGCRKPVVNSGINCQASTWCNSRISEPSTVCFHGFFRPQESSPQFYLKIFGSETFHGKKFLTDHSLGCFNAGLLGSVFSIRTDSLDIDSPKIGSKTVTCLCTC